LRGISVCLFDYRGYGKSTGTTKINTLFYDMEDKYIYLTKTIQNNRTIVAAGESIGSYPAAKLANKYQLKKLIIFYGLYSLSLTIKHLYPILHPFLKLFVSKDLQVYKELETYNGDTLILHSKEDNIVNYNNAIENSKIKSYGNIKLITITGGHNNAIIDWETVSLFIKS
jgi:esterase/lipase